MTNIQVDENGVEFVEFDGFKIRVKAVSIKDTYSVETYTKMGYSFEDSVQRVYLTLKRQSPRYIEHYLAKGMSQEDAEKALEQFLSKKRVAKEKKEQDPRTRDYWLARGYSLEQAISESGRVKSLNTSKRSKKYWISLGYSEEEAVKKVSEIQKQNSPKCKEYWIKRGYSEEDAIKQVSEYQSKICNSNPKLHDRQYQREKSVRCIEHYLAKGLSEEEAREQVRLVSDNVSEKAFQKRYGDTWREERDLYLKKMSLSNSGKRNGMYGKSAPKGSGHGYSGYYKSYYFRSLFEYFYIKQCERDKVPFVCNDVSKKVFKGKIVIPISENRNYIPDFIEGTDTVVEVKNKYVLESSYKSEKMPYLIDYCQQHGMKYRILTEDDLNLDYASLVEDFNAGLVVIDKGKLGRFKKHILSMFS